MVNTGKARKRKAVKGKWMRHVAVDKSLRGGDCLVKDDRVGPRVFFNPRGPILRKNY